MHIYTLAEKLRRQQTEEGTFLLNLADDDDDS